MGSPVTNLGDNVEADCVAGVNLALRRRDHHVMYDVPRLNDEIELYGMDIEIKLNN